MVKVFFCIFCEASKNNFPNRTPPVAASVVKSLLRSAILTDHLNHNNVDKTTDKMPSADPYQLCTH